MSSPLGQASKSQTAGSQAGGSSAKTGQPLRRRRTRMLNEKKIADDEFMAAAIGDVEWLKQSIKDNGRQVNFDKNGLTAFHLAAIHGRLDCLKLCIEKFNYDLNLPSSTGWRPVHLVISNQTGKRALNCLKYLLDKGADPSVANDDMITPVHQAASEGHVQCLKLLLEAGADINSKDCRGNTPLDLAKLWSHRKCGRILAAEIWHQEKDYVAKEMNQLQKVKMKQVLKELEDEEERHTAQEFYGQQAFKDWLATRNLEEKPVGPSPKHEYHYDDSARHPLSKPNSVVPSGKSHSLKSGKNEYGLSPSPVKDKIPPAFKRDPTYNTEYTEDFEDYDEEILDFEDGRKSCTSPLKLSPRSHRKKLTLIQHPSPWNISTKAKEGDYIPILKDEYPRDEFTLMPKTKPEQKYYDGKHAKPVDVTEENKTKKKTNSGKTRAIDLPQDVLDKVLSRDPSILERPILFKPKHVIDLPAKKKLDFEVKPKDEVSLHLCSDVTSILFKNSLKIPLSHSAKSSSSSSSENTDWRNQNFPRSMVANALKQMSKANRFPKSSGQEYEINFGELKGI
ncbi:ankyrin-3 [Patella vulgata]|uniref:ankyrin-3 n=1 Tax=Patella vulgata TaxID=6465 RepID=UPI00217F989B|nr:ankyrin-3 [Patella vulgata]